MSAEIKAGDRIRVPGPAPSARDPLAQRPPFAIVHAVCPPFVVTEEGDCFGLDRVKAVSAVDVEKYTLAISAMAIGLTVVDFADLITLDLLKEMVREHGEKHARARRVVDLDEIPRNRAARSLS